MKKIHIIGILTLILLLITGCFNSNNDDNPKEEIYKILYYVDGELVNLNPSSYIKGKGINLPSPTYDNLTFSGWYDNTSYDGSVISAISPSDTGDKIFYGKTEGEIIPDKIYNITYYINGSEALLNPATYIEGTITNLPTPTYTNATFNGWYTNSECTGTKITSISSNEFGDKVFYGKVEASTNPEITDEEALKKLSKALSIDNYSYEYIETYNEIKNVETYQKDKDTYSNTYDYGYGEVYTDYLTLVDEFYRIVYEYENIWYYTIEGDLTFDSMYAYMVLIDLASFDINNFTYNKIDNSYILSAAALQTTIEQFMGSYDGEIFESCTIYLNNDKLHKIVIGSNYEYYGEYYDSTYEFNFSNIGTTKINVPDAIYEGDYEIRITAIEDIYNLTETSTVTIEGVVTGRYGNNFYINDGTGSILVYCGSDTTYNSLATDGSTIILTGDIEFYKDLPQITNVVNLGYSSTEITTYGYTLTDVSQEALKNSAGDFVNLMGAELVSKNISTTFSDSSFVVKFIGNEVSVFMSKHLENDYKNDIIKSLDTASIGDTIDITNLHIGKYNEYQLIITSTTFIELSAIGPKEEIGLYLEPSSMSVIKGTTIDDIYDKVNVYVKYSDNSIKPLETSEYVKTTNFKSNTLGNYTITYTYKGYTSEVKIEVYESGENYIQTNVTSSELKEKAKGFDLTGGLPSIGEPKVLVIPVAFTDYPAPVSMKSDLEIAFFGTSRQTGWESLQSYYYKSSYGKLNITGTVLEPFNTGRKSTSYTGENFDYEIIKAALEYYDTQLNYDDYDTDYDGYIDSIYIVYTRDYDSTGNTNWWAYSYQYYTEDYEYYDNVEADFYSFFSYQFLFDELQGKNISYNAETIIHETGHLLGLDDYYDYDESKGPDGGIGGGDMMDFNVGDHNPYSKVLLGWVSPIVLTGQTVNIDLKSFATSGEAVMICKKWNGTFYDEYFIIDFYTPTGVNEFVKGESGLFSIDGIRIYHINSALDTYDNAIGIWNMTKSNNSDTSNKLISLVEADGNNDILNLGYSQNTDLFGVGKTYSGAKWYDKTSAGFTLKVNTMTSTVANITITF